MPASGTETDPRRAFRVAYDGRPYYGFQRQPDVPTVEDTLFDALRQLDLEFGDRPPGYAAAGRTDAGVSALAQTVAFDAPEWLSPSAFSAELPDSIRVWASTAVPPEFHATHHAISREYTYHLHAPKAVTDRIDAVEAALAGEHDFHNLTADDEGTVRNIALDIETDGAYFLVTVTAGGFPRQLVRRLVTLVDSVTTGDEPLETIERVLGPEPIDGPEGIPPAPAYPLVLTDVEYDHSFEPDPAAAADGRAVFETRASAHRTRARVASTIADGL